MTSPSLFKTLSKRSKIQSTEKSDNLFELLKERGKLENERPQAITYALMERVDEVSLLKKDPAITAKRNLLNATFFTLKNPKTNQYFRLDEREKFLWDKMDGSHSIRDLALEYYNHYGAFAYDKIVELVYDLKKKTLLTESYEDIFKNLSVLAKSTRFLSQLYGVIKKFFYWEFPLQRVDGIFELLYRLTSWCFHKTVIYTIVLVVILGFGAFFAESSSSRYSVLQSDNSLAYGVVVLILLNIIALFFHELAHGVATKHFRRSVHKTGFLIYFGWPSFYVDTTDMWMEEKEKRIFVSLAGPLVEAFIAGIISIVLLFSPQNEMTTLLYKFSFVSYISLFMNLNPLIEWDGYFILMDYLGIPCLRKRSLFFVKESLMKKFIKREQFSHEEKIYTIFGIFAFGWSMVAVLLGVNFWKNQLSNIFHRFK